MSAPAEGRPTPARRILLIDDNDDARELMAVGLELYGHEVATAASGARGLARAREFQPEVVFLDLGMPVMDGYETAVGLRRITGLERIVVAALSGWNDQATLARVIDARFDHHLTKPATFAQIDSVLRGEYQPVTRPPLQGPSRHL
ncbi:response regulator [Massilia sp. 2TAF26]|uniref:response regulator n=1 Tax=Massilia sp. 2TAF26 TaxID=3233012 RepID=UPI003F9C2A11